MNARITSLFLLVALVISLPASGALSPGRVYPLQFIDVDGNELSTADGHVSVIVFSPQSEADKAEIVGDRIPEYCLGNPDYRMITIVGFGNNRSRPVQMLFTTVVRHRLDTEADRLRPRYAAKNLNRNPRTDIFAVADFDGTAASQLGRPDSSTFAVYVFDRRGKLVRQWSDIPSKEELAAALR